MMRRNVGILAVLIALSLVFTAHAEEAVKTDNMGEIQARLRMLRDLGNPQADPNTDGAAVGKLADEARAMNGQYQSLEQRIARGDLVSSRQTVQQWISTTTSPDLRRIYEDLAKQIGVQLDLAATKLSAQFDDMFKRAAEVCRNAKTASDLDTITSEIEDMRQGGMSNESRNYRLRRRLDGAMNFLQIWERYLSAVESNSLPAAIQALREAGGRDFGGSRYQLLPTSEINTLRDNLQNKLNAEMSAVFTSMSGPPAAEATIEEWEKFSDSIQGLYEQINSGATPRSNAIRRRLDLLNNGMSYWMQVLYLERAGNFRGALRQLQSFDSGNYLDGSVFTPALISSKRVKLTEALAARGVEDSPEIKDLTQAMLLLKQPSDVPTVWRRVAAYENTTGNDGEEIRSLRGNLAMLMRMSGALDEGRIGDFWNAMSQSSSEAPHRWFAATQAVRQTLVLRMIASSSLLSDLGQPAEGETLDRMFLRLADQAAAKGDWKRVLALLDAMRRYAYAYGQPPLWLGGEIEAVQYYLTARQLEDVGEFADAMASYRAVLRISGDRVPVKDAAKRLAALREAHPTTQPSGVQ